MTEVRKGPVLALIVASYFMIVLDISIVITGLPGIEAELAFSPTDLSWVHPPADGPETKWGEQVNDAEYTNTKEGS